MFSRIGLKWIFENCLFYWMIWGCVCKSSFIICVSNDVFVLFCFRVVLEWNILLCDGFVNGCFFLCVSGFGNVCDFSGNFEWCMLWDFV